MHSGNGQPQEEENCGILSEAGHQMCDGEEGAKKAQERDKKEALGGRL